MNFSSKKSRLRAGEQILLKKGHGQLIHILDFVEEVNGRLVILHEDGTIQKEAQQIIFPFFQVQMGIPIGIANNSQYFTLPHGFWQTPTDSDRNVGIPSGICQNGQNLSFCWILMESKWNSIPTDSKFIPLDSKGHSNTFQVHSAGFQPIPTHSMGHSNTFQHIPTHFMGHSNTFQVEFYSNGFQVPSKCHVT